VLNWDQVKVNFLKTSDYGILDVEQIAASGNKKFVEFSVFENEY
jgi:hypothetical protein